jgi:hypothetical protein
LLGLFYSPLFFSFHLFGVIHNPDLAIVLSSVLMNVRRLTTVFMFTIMVMYFFAISGLLIFETNNAAAVGSGAAKKKKGASGTEVGGTATDALDSRLESLEPLVPPPPPGKGQCATLMQCFISYTYRGINMQG